MLKLTISKIRGIEKVKAYLNTVAHGTKSVAISALADYIIGDGTHGLKQYPRYKHVTRKAAYGRTFQSDKQRRWFFANLHEGNILPGYPRRTGRLQRGWDKKGSSTKITIFNREPYAKWVHGDRSQANLNALVGWRKTMDIVKSNVAGAIRHARAKVKEYLKTRKP